MNREKRTGRATEKRVTEEIIISFF